MDVIFDIDGTLAEASHRLHFIKNHDFFLVDRVGSKDTGWRDVLKPDWDSFLSDDQVAKDAPIPQTWFILNQHLAAGHRVLFITGRNETSRWMTSEWLGRHLQRGDRNLTLNGGCLYMRSKYDRRPSHEVKRDLLNKARADGFNPTLVFEDRKDDTAMWRSEGLLCCQVAEGDY